MTRPLLDKILLCTLLPAFAVVLGLHLREANQNGLVQPPIYATWQGADEYPVVGGRRLERGWDWAGMQAGDRLIRAGDRDLRGAGYIGFDAYLLAAAGSSGHAALVFERDGARHEVDLKMGRSYLPWYRVPFMLGIVLLATIVLIRSPGSAESRFLYGGFVCFAIFETPFMGGPPIQTIVDRIIFHGLGGIAIGLILAFLARLPKEVPERYRISRYWGLLGVFFVLVRLPYFLDWPIPSSMTPRFVLVCDASFLAVGLYMLIRNAFHAEPIGRRRIQWVLLGGIVSVTPMLTTLVAQPLLPSEVFRRAFEYSAVAAVAMPLFCFIAIQRANLFDIHRLLSSTAAYTAGLAGALAAALALAPALGSLFARVTGLDEGASRGLVAGLLAIIAVPFGRRMRPVVDRVFFPERVARDRSFGRLLRDLSECQSRDELLALLRTRVQSVLHLKSCVLYTRGGDAFEAAGRPDTPRFDGDAPLSRALESDPMPLRVAPAALERAVPDLTDRERSDLITLGAQLVLPVCEGKDLAGFLALGPKLSGDVFPPTELTLLGAVAEKASAELARLRDSHALEGEREQVQKMTELKNEAESANRAKSRFLAAASHDLRQPLHALGLFAERLTDHIDGDVGRALAEQVQNSTRSLRSQFDSLLDLSRLDAGGVEPDVQTFELGPDLARLAAETSVAARQKGLELRFEPVQARVRSDPALLNRIVQNLLANAVRYTDEGSVRLRARPRSDILVIEVADTGPGIPVERQREIFDEFVRIDPRADGDGLGLGLSIVDRTAKLLGHRVELKSTPGGGSTFRVEVPLIGPSVQPAPPSPAPGGHLAGSRVLIVEDEVGVVDAMRGLLESWGCGVLVADSAEAALRALAAGADAPAAIIADYRLGEGENGVDVVKRVRILAGHEVPAVVVSGETARESIRAIRDSGLPYLPKPVPPARLRALLGELLRPEDPTRH